MRGYFDGNFIGDGVTELGQRLDRIWICKDFISDAVDAENYNSEEKVYPHILLTNEQLLDEDIWPHRDMWLVVTGRVFEENGQLCIRCVNLDNFPHIFRQHEVFADCLFEE